MNLIILSGQVVGEPRMLGEGNKRRCVTRIVTHAGEGWKQQLHNLVAWRKDGDALFEGLKEGEWVLVQGRQENSRFLGQNKKTPIYWSQVLIKPVEGNVEFLGRHGPEPEISEKEAALPPYQDLGEIPDDGWEPYGEEDAI